MLQEIVEIPERFETQVLYWIESKKLMEAAGDLFEDSLIDENDYKAIDSRYYDCCQLMIKNNIVANPYINWEILYED
jgi:hypothetical protein